ncbi:hypothetical protein GIB67_041414 [Kingdonia uniflora]|uniref:BSD domain-containing protein n=1 Tax=Kingdonia uniflora TaxID=39325 RepID=A0A7J7LRL7_9MAGN|nr:hypothetical protein GIB67_041414 [Kingdonia uniflora]
MDFFKSVFSDDPDPSDFPNDEQTPFQQPNPTPKSPTTPATPTTTTTTTTSAWSFGGLMKTIATKSESVIETYRRDLEEFGSGLKKETAVIREVASRAVKDLPVSLEAGASVAQGSLESVGQVIDEFGSSVWRGTTEIITQSKDAILSDSIFESDSSDNNNNISNQQFRNAKRYSRFDTQVNFIQSDLATYSEEPDDLDEFNNWKLGFSLEGREEELETLLFENEGMEEAYVKLAPSVVDHETFWGRYFYKVYKLKQVEDARANLVKRAISGEEEDLSWDVDDDENNGASYVDESRGDGLSGIVEPEKNNEALEVVMEKKAVEETKGTSSEVIDREVEGNNPVVEPDSDNESNEKVGLEEKVEQSKLKNDEPVAKSDEKTMMVEEKAEPVESCKDSDVSIVSTQPSAEEEDLGWDEIEDLGSGDERKVSTGSGGSPNRADLRKRLSAAEEDEDLSWDIEDDDEHVKPPS